MTREFSEKFKTLICFFESTVFILAIFVPVYMHIHNEYSLSLNGMFSCESVTSLNHKIILENGIEYPAGTSFNVYFITGSGGLGLLSSDNRLISHGEINICETNNPDELNSILSRSIAEMKNEHKFTVAIVLIISSLLYVGLYKINSIINKSYNKKTCAIIALMYILLSAIVFVFLWFYVWKNI